MTEHITFFIYGLCVMFYSMMVWMFYRKNKEKLSRLITCLMAILDMECLKDLLLFVDGIGAQSTIWYLMNAIDMVIIPFYMFVLMELVKPGWLTWGKGILHEAIFILPLAVYAFTRKVCHLCADVLLYCSLSAPAQGAFLLSGKCQSPLAQGHSHLLLHHSHSLVGELLYV